MLKCMARHKELRGIGAAIRAKIRAINRAKTRRYSSEASLSKLIAAVGFHTRHAALAIVLD